MKLQLIAPTEKVRESFLRGLREFRHEGLPWHLAVDLEAVERDFAAFVAGKLADAHRTTDAFVPRTHLWAIAEIAEIAEIDGVESPAFVGRISILHALTDALRIEGGQIGYDTVPSFRGRGVAREMLRQALPMARARGFTEVLLTCDDTNAASIRVIESNGGVLRETRSIDAKRPLKRYYWIAL